MTISRRTLLRQLAAAGLLGNIPLAIRQVMAAGNRPMRPGIYQLSGTVTLNGKPAAEGMPVNPGDTLVTGANSRAIYVIGQDAYLQRDNSTVSILGTTVTSGLRILSGKLLSVFGKGNKQLQTSTATIGIRGTGCYIESEPERTYFCLCYGTADVAPVAAPDKPQTLVTKHHEAPVWISRNDKEKPMSAAGVVNHSDDELDLLESLVGRTTPFAGSDVNRY
ncbi:MAG TPA: hypothetical protein PLW86_08635 [Rhodocyclaceae bacterium]|nr:hypothetical protein [Rhodocyclaceae bacterium]